MIKTNSPLIQPLFSVTEQELLVTSNRSSLTYKNLYCGLCNGEQFDTLMSWSWNFDCIGNFPSGATAEPGTSITQQAM